LRIGMSTETRGFVPFVIVLSGEASFEISKPSQIW
jgi:hypothetical protein